MADGNKGIPQTIKIGGVDIVVKDNPELLELIQTARQQEKDKLYSRIGTLEAEVKVLETAKKTSEGLTTTQEKELNDLREKLGAEKAQKENVETQLKEIEGAKAEAAKKEGDGKTDPPKTVDTGMKATDVQKIVDEALKKQAEAYETRLAAVQGNLTAKEVNDYRDKILTNNKDLIIPALLPEGLKTTAEVDAALLKAIEISKPYITKTYVKEDGKSEQLTLAEIEALEQAKVEKAKTPTYVPPTAPARPEVGDPDLAGAKLLEKLNNNTLSDEEYEKNRDEIKRLIESVEYKPVV